MQRALIYIGFLLFFLPASGQDVALTAITSPLSGCMLTNNRNVTVQIFNDETSMLNTAFDVTYIISGPISDSVTETISTLILAKSIYTYTFQKKADLSVPGTYTITSYTALSNDKDRTDDTLKGYIVTSDTFSVGGLVSDSGLSVCASGNSHLLQLSNYTGNILHWEFSGDGLNWTQIPNTRDTNRVTNITMPVWYRAIVKNGLCPADTSQISILQIDSPSVGGTLSGSITICALNNSDTLWLAGHRGDVLRWESSVNGGSTWTPLSDTTDRYIFTNLTATTEFRAIVQNRNCSAMPSSPVTVYVDQASFGGSLGDSALVCSGSNGDTLHLTGHTGAILDWESSPDSGLTWLSLGHTDSLHSYLNLSSSAWYRVIVQNGVCPADTSNITLVNAGALPPAVDAGSDTIIMQGDTITLSGSCNVSFYWSPGQELSDSTVLSPRAHPTANITYYLIARDSLGCSSIDSVRIAVTPPGDTIDYDILITNTITANRDGINDTWYIENIALYPDAEVFVYNIHGNEVFHATAYDNQWDGTYKGSRLPDGTYFYIVKPGRDTPVLKGSLTIIGN